MRRTALRAALAVATVAGIAISSTAAFAEDANDWESGLTFYSSDYVTPLANFPAPDGECHAFPATAGLLIGWSNFEHVIAYRTADCSGDAFGLGTLRSFDPGEFASFIAY
ncbi:MULTISPECIES: hypothetical protein [unclassified Corallococcus]|uniref:hypothetical protein n=1 Tax=unclassified Corallococcus TaxID=2685029 RepID=UPI001A8DCDF2|nr:MULTISPECIES: hypothetical protein [unclassified Corallococcus]MBN9685953.1 hypothetical protein [Corallococcus sp. NCSPR001]WAS82607.1 hypothetical protein O0N60_25165 [Corallococcus sp. NCRR]